LQFVDEGRTFTCRSESSPGTPGVLWWWFNVAGDPQRYAGFQVAAGDTVTSVRRRIVAHYADVLAIRARPRMTRPEWVQRKAAPASPAEPARPESQPS
jgi:hypothetical protein